MINKRKNKIENPHAFEEAILSWKAPEYLKHEKSHMWFLVAGIIALLLVFYGFASGGWTFSLAIIVFAGTYYLLHREDPKIVDVKISEMGVKIGRRIYPYSDMRGFWIVYEPPHVTKLYFKLIGKFQPDVFVALGDCSPAQARNSLRKHTKELEGFGEPFSDALVRVFKL